MQKTLKEKVSELYEKIIYPVKIGLTTISAVALLNAPQFINPTRAYAQQKRTEYLLPIIQDSSPFYPTILEHLLDQVDNSEINRFERPINIYIDPEFQNKAPEVRTKLINAFNSLNAQKPNTISVVTDTLSSKIEFMHKENSFADTEKEYDENGNIKKVKVYHDKNDMNFNRLLLTSLGLRSKLEQDDITESGLLSNMQSQIFDAYFNFPNRTNLRKFIRSVSDTLAPTVVLIAPDSVYTGQEFTLDSSGSSDNDKIEKRYWQFRENYHENSVFKPDSSTTTVEDKITISFPDSSFIGERDIALVVTDPTKNSSSIVSRKIKVLPVPQNYVVKVRLIDPLLNEGVYGLKVLLKGKSAFTDSTGTTILEYLSQSFTDTLKVERTLEYAGIGSPDFPYIVSVSSDTTIEEALFPLVPLDSTVYSDLLSFMRAMNNDGNNIITVWQNLPIQVYKGNPPIQKFEDARVASLTNWENKTFTWKGRTITPHNYFEDVDSDPTIGMKFEYDAPLTQVIWEGDFGGERGHAPDGTPRKAIIRIKSDEGVRTLDNLTKLYEHEEHHILDDSGVEDMDDNNASFPNSGHHVSENDSKRMVTMYKLTEFYKSKGKFPDLRVYN